MAEASAFPSLKNPLRFPAPSPATRQSVPSDAPATICTIAATTSWISRKRAEFEEIAHLLIHEALPNAEQLKAYKEKLKSLRGLPPAVKQALEAIPVNAHPMDVMRTGCSVLGTVEQEPETTTRHGARITRPHDGQLRFDAGVLVSISPTAASASTWRRMTTP